MPFHPRDVVSANGSLGTTRSVVGLCSGIHVDGIISIGEPGRISPWLWKEVEGAGSVVVGAATGSLLIVYPSSNASLAMATARPRVRRWLLRCNWT